ncbi:MAG: DUF3268 family zinc-finger domain-containing protein [Candidatus Cloacimonetes bacterium]|nr:DUF3268 family zinc-finger domain-containing protein [Candidatus Cloacimonadota bacterium]
MTKTNIELCPYCGKEVVLKDSSIIYGKSYGMVWICSDWPKCDAYVGCQKGSSKPLGRLANKELRFWKKQAHDTFDKLWKLGKMSRTDAYTWLSRQLLIPQDKCHIGMFDIDQCKLVCNIVKGYKNKCE